MSNLGVLRLVTLRDVSRCGAPCEKCKTHYDKRLTHFPLIYVREIQMKIKVDETQIKRVIQGSKILLKQFSVQTLSGNRFHERAVLNIFLAMSSISNFSNHSIKTRAGFGPHSQSLGFFILGQIKKSPGI